jgi:acyl-CoA dehydrogenase
MSGDEDIKKKAAALLEQGNIFAFGLSEKAHGADIYSSDMIRIDQNRRRYLHRQRQEIST